MDSDFDRLVVVQWQSLMMVITPSDCVSKKNLPAALHQHSHILIFWTLHMMVALGILHHTGNIYFFLINFVKKIINIFCYNCCYMY